MKQKYKVVSINVGQPKQVERNNKIYLTSIDKRPVNQPVYLSKLNLAGDAQADLASTNWERNHPLFTG
ncbi:MOSC domain-containing protein YiiM [Caldalkalibacillus uzonensis]|uniref:MOSC domain-containing protein YiiM n=1 Tax=Caldalkalibacillus uzonensis TaxID=353224 RepID=A0ABU0CSB9_9BACI|nr:hypothetical protein [Caldalkalibacillus uzonensis]MDQ0339290.1 MOSC domain-containing protein YiiM [Caldalkalibacillus uzonensis]